MMNTPIDQTKCWYSCLNIFFESDLYLWSAFLADLYFHAVDRHFHCHYVYVMWYDLLCISPLDAVIVNIWNLDSRGFFCRNRAWNLMQPDFKRVFNRVKLSRFLSNPKDHFQNFDFWIISQIFTLRHLWSCQFSTHSRWLIEIVVHRQRQLNGAFPVIIFVIMSLFLWGFDLIFLWIHSAQIMRETLKNIFHIRANPCSKWIHQIHNYRVQKQDSFVRSKITEPTHFLPEQFDRKRIL
jgi:hypothetical protein